MLARTMDIQEAQVHFVDLVALVVDGTEVILTKNKKPLMRLVPIAGQAVITSTEVVMTPVAHEEGDTWSFLAQTGLNGAYGDHEPEYSLSMIQEPNPVYAGR